MENRKGEIACNKQFLLFSRCFLSYMLLIFHFKCTLKCRLQFVSIWTSLKFCRLVMGYNSSCSIQRFYKQILTSYCHWTAVPLTGTDDRISESAGQDQTARMCSLILLYTLRKNKSNSHGLQDRA